MKSIRATVLAAAIAVLSAAPANAHCDTLDGPVVGAARAALETGNINPALIWVNQANEAELKTAFQQTLDVRRLNAAARDLADRSFFETLVRLHRQGEGAPYTGLKPSGTDLGPAVMAADQAIATGNSGKVSALLNDAVQAGLHQKYERVLATRNHDKNNVQAGREYVEAYVQYVHYVEGVHQAASGTHAEEAGH